MSGPFLLFIIGSLFSLLTAIYPWTPGFDIAPLGIPISVHEIGNIGAVLMALSGILMLAVSPWRKRTQGWTEWLDGTQLTSRQDQTLVWTLGLAYALIATSLKLRQHWVFQTHGADYGIIANIAWNTLQGRWFWSSWHGASHLAIHADTGIGLMGPAYLLWRNPAVILIVQSVVLGLVIPPLYWLVRETTGRRSLAIAAVLLYCGHPFILRTSMNDVHYEHFSIAFILWAMWALRRERWGWLTFFIFLAVTVKEDQNLVIAAWGASVALFDKRHRKAGLVIAAATVIGFVADMHWVIGWAAKRWPTQQNLILQRYAALGHTYPELFMSLLNPAKLFPALFTPWDKPYAAIRLLGWLWYMPLFAFSEFIPAATALLPHILSSSPGQYQLSGLYPSAALPFLLAGLGEAWVRLKLNQTVRRAQAVLAAALLTAGVGILASPRFVGNYDPAKVATGHKMLGLIPPDASVRAQSDLLPHLELREHLQSFPMGVTEDGEFTSLLNPDYIALEVDANGFPFTHEKYLRAVADLEKKGDYDLIFNENGFELWKRKHPGPAEYQDNESHPI